VQEDEEESDPSYPQGRYATDAILRALQRKMVNPERDVLWQLAKIMDHLDWTRIQSRADLVRYLSQGVFIMVSIETFLMLT
jgi:hypothetical protein